MKMVLEKIKKRLKGESKKERINRLIEQNKELRKRVLNLDKRTTNLENERDLLKEENKRLRERIEKLEDILKPKNIEFEISIDAEYKGTKKEDKKSVMNLNVDIQGVASEYEYNQLVDRVEKGNFLATIMKENLGNFRSSSLASMSNAFSKINTGVIKEERTNKNPSNIEGVIDIKSGGSLRFEK